VDRAPDSSNYFGGFMRLVFLKMSLVLPSPYGGLVMLLLSKAIGESIESEPKGSSALPVDTKPSNGYARSYQAEHSFWDSWHVRDKDPGFFTPHVFDTQVRALEGGCLVNEVPPEVATIVVAIELEPLMKLYHLVQGAEVEVSWNMLVKLEGNVVLKIYDLVVPYQEGLPSHFDVSASMKGKAAAEDLYGSGLSEAEIDARINDCRVHGHSHVWMPTYPSPLDEEFIKGILERDKPAFFVRCIANKKGRLSFDLYLVGDGILVRDLPWRYEWPQFDSASVWAKEQLERKLTVVEPKWTWGDRDHTWHDSFDFGCDAASRNDVKRDRWGLGDSRV
jgi:hypothetical protein